MKLTNVMKKINITHFVSDGRTEYNSSRWRCSNMSDALIKAGHKVNILDIRLWLENNYYTRKIIEKSDVIIVHRVAIRQSINVLEYWRNRNKIVLMDFDDGYLQLTGGNNPAQKYWINGELEIKLGDYRYTKLMEEHPIKLLKEFVSKASGLTVPSKQLVLDWQKFNPNTFLLPNYINSALYSRNLTPKHIHNGEVWMGWGGSLGHIESFLNSGIDEALRFITDKYSFVKFLLIGDARILEKIKLKESQYIFLPYTVYNNWPTMLAKFDIGLAPLAGDFDMRRSPIKVLEYVTYGIPFLATNCIVYNDFNDVDSGILVNNSSDNWIAEFEKIINNLNNFNQAAINNIILSKKYDASENVPNIVNFYQSLM